MASAYNSVGSGLPQVPISMPVSTYNHQTSASPTNHSYLAGSYQTTGERRITGATTGGERVESVRKISSTIVEESYLGPRPTDLPTRQVEIPTIEEKEVRVTRKEQREKVVEKRVPVVEWVERIVEVPRVEYIDRVVEVPTPQEVFVDKPVKVYQDRPYEVIQEKKVPQVKQVVKDVEVPGQIIEVPKPYTVEVPVSVNRYTDRQVPMVVAQTIKPYIVEGQGEYEVDVVEYEAECFPVDVHVIKPVATNIEAYGVVESMHRVITVPAAQYNTMLQQLNSHLTQVEVQKLPYVSSVGGSVQFLSEQVSYTQPQAGVEIHGFNPATAVNTWTAERSATTTVSTTAGAVGAQYSAGTQYSVGAQYSASPMTGQGFGGQYSATTVSTAGGTIGTQYAAGAQYSAGSMAGQALAGQYSTTSTTAGPVGSGPQYSSQYAQYSSGLQKYSIPAQ